MIKFRERCELARGNLLDLIDNLHNQGKCIVGYGAATKSTIILNYAGIRKSTIEYMVDSTPYKQGKYLPVTGLQVFSPEDVINQLDKATDIFVMNSNYLSEIKKLTNNQFNYITVDHERI